MMGSRLDRVSCRQGSSVVSGCCRSPGLDERSAGVADAVVGSQIHLLVFDAAPQPPAEDVVPPSPFAVHADRNAVAGERAGEAALVNCKP